MTSQEPETPPSADAGIPDTEVINIATAAPVFVDATGRRSRLLRRGAYAFGVVCVLYGGLVSVSLAGGPVSSSAVLPLPDLLDKDDKAAVAPKPAPTPSPSKSNQLITEALRRPESTSFTRRAEAPRVTPGPARTTKPGPKPPAKPSGKPSTTRTKAQPVESTTKPVTDPSPVASAEPSAPAPAPESPIKPPVPPAPLPGGGGGGGGAAEDSGADTDDTPVIRDTDAEESDTGGSGGSASGGDTGGTKSAAPSPPPPADEPEIVRTAVSKPQPSPAAQTAPTEADDGAAA